MCMYTGKTEWLLLFLTQHTRKSIGSKEAVFHCVHFCHCQYFACVSPLHHWPLWLLCAFLVFHSISCSDSNLPHSPFFFLNFRFFVSIHVYFSSFASSHSFFASPIPNHANNCTCFCNISKFTDQFFFSGLFSVSQPFLLIFFLCLIFILKFKKQLNGVQEQQDPSPPLTHTSHSFLQDLTSPGPQLQSQYPGRPSQALPPYPAPPLTRHQHLR